MSARTLIEGVRKMVEWAKKVDPQKPIYKLPSEIQKERLRSGKKG